MGGVGVTVEGGIPNCGIGVFGAEGGTPNFGVGGFGVNTEGSLVIGVICVFGDPTGIFGIPHIWGCVFVTGIDGLEVGIGDMLCIFGGTGCFPVTKGIFLGGNGVKCDDLIGIGVPHRPSTWEGEGDGVPSGVWNNCDTGCLGSGGVPFTSDSVRF